jgi:hypothetical protein
MKLLFLTCLVGILIAQPASAQTIPGNFTDVETLFESTWNDISQYIPPFILEMGERVIGIFEDDIEKEKARIHKEYEKEKQELIVDFNKQTQGLFQHLWSQVRVELPPIEDMINLQMLQKE